MQRGGSASYGMGQWQASNATVNDVRKKVLSRVSVNKDMSLGAYQ